MSSIDIIVRLRDQASAGLSRMRGVVNGVGGVLKKAFGAAGFLSAAAALRGLHSMLTKIRENADLTIISDKQINNIERAASALQDAGKEIKSQIAANIGTEFEVGMATMAQTIANLMKGQGIKEAMSNAGREVMGKVEGTIGTQADTDAEDARRESEMQRMFKNTASASDIKAKRDREHAEAVEDAAEATRKRAREDEEADLAIRDARRASAKAFREMAKEGADYAKQLGDERKQSMAQRYGAEAQAFGEAAGVHGALALDGSARSASKAAARAEARRRKKLDRLADRATRKLMDGGRMTDAETEALKARSFEGQAKNAERLRDQYAEESSKRLKEIAENTSFLKTAVTAGR